MEYSPLNFFKRYFFFLAVLVLRCCVGFSLVAGAALLAVRGLLIAVASLVVVHGLQDTQASVAVGHGHTIWDVPRSGIELASPELAGRFFTTEPPGKSSLFFSFFLKIYF